MNHIGITRQDARKPSRKNLFIRTFGCQMNEYDSLKLEKILDAEYQRVATPENADLVLINTCSVRGKPEHKVYSLLGELRALKEINPAMMIGVGGCVAQQEGKNLVERSKDIDFVFGTHNLSLVPALIGLRQGGAEPQVAVDYRDEWEDLPLGFAPGERVSAFIAISRGCNKNCTYCVVPHTRGVEVSRSQDEILREIRLAVQRGAKEVLLLGQTVNSYGRDLNPRRSFVDLLGEISCIDGLKRIRFTSPHPQEVREDFVDLVTRNPKVCRHIHMPLQSGSDRILKLMNRNYRRAKYLRIIEALKSRVPDMAITTDIIVGFPGESDEDFRATLEVMDVVQFEGSFSFVFSPRPNTLAAAMTDTQPYEEKLARLQVLQEKQNSITKSKLESWVGKGVEVLFEGPSEGNPDCLRGRSSQNFVVNMERNYAHLKPGALANVTISGANRFTLKATHNGAGQAVA